MLGVLLHLDGVSVTGWLTRIDSLEPAGLLVLQEVTEATELRRSDLASVETAFRPCFAEVKALLALALNWTPRTFLPVGAGKVIGPYLGRDSAVLAVACLVLTVM